MGIYWPPIRRGHYREYLKARGFADADTDDQIKLIDAEGRRSEIDRWNRVLTAEKPSFNIKPNDFLVEIAKGTQAGDGGGVLVVEAFHRDATKGRSIGGAVVFDTGQLPSLFPQLRVVRYEEPMAKADIGQDGARGAVLR